MKWFISLAIIIVIILLIRYFYFRPILGFGEACPSFNAESINGNQINLEKFKGKYLILDFWGSWCGPCRRDNQIMVLFYEKYREQKFKTANGLSILSVALEKDKQDALDAIEQDGLIWPDHIVQTLKMMSSMALTFGVKEIPQKFLISPDGKILLTNPDFKELDDYLAHQVAKN